jgi:hypothetical protein
MSNNPVRFREVQQFHQVYLWVILLIPVALLWSIVVPLLLFKDPLSHPVLGPSMLAMVIVSILVGLGVPLLFYFARLVTEVREDGIYLKYSPFHLKERYFAFSEIKLYEVRRYRPIMEYGGWGIRYALRGRAYNVFGNMGLQLELTGGKRILIGTQRPEEFQAALDAFIKK